MCLLEPPGGDLSSCPSVFCLHLNLFMNFSTTLEMVGLVGPDNYLSKYFMTFRIIGLFHRACSPKFDNFKASVLLHCTKSCFFTKHFTAIFSVSLYSILSMYHAVEYCIPSMYQYIHVVLLKKIWISRAH